MLRGIPDPGAVPKPVAAMDRPFSESSHQFKDRGLFLFRADGVLDKNRRHESVRVSGPIVEIFQRIDSARSFLVHRPPMYQPDVLQALHDLLFLVHQYAVKVAETNRPWPGPPLLAKALVSRRSPSFFSSYSIVWPQTEGVCSEWLSKEPLCANSWEIPYAPDALYVQVLGIQEHFLNCSEARTYDDDGDWLMSQHMLAPVGVHVDDAGRLLYQPGCMWCDDGGRLEYTRTYTLHQGRPPPSQCRQNQSCHTEVYREGNGRRPY